MHLGFFSIFSTKPPNDSSLYQVSSLFFHQTLMSKQNCALFFRTQTKFASNKLNETIINQYINQHIANQVVYLYNQHENKHDLNNQPRWQICIQARRPILPPYLGSLQRARVGESPRPSADRSDDFSYAYNRKNGKLIGLNTILWGAFPWNVEIKI